MENKDLLVRFDWVIKTMLRNKSNFDILEGFLSALLKDDITIIEILESEGNQETAQQKFNRVDVLIKDSKNRKIIIEVQSESESDFLERLLFGTSKAIVDYFKIGESYSTISKVISISVQYFNMGRGTDYIYHGNTVIRGIHTGDVLEVRERIETTIDGELRIKLQEKNIFPEYYIISVNRYLNIVKEDIDEWIYMMKNNIVEDSFHSKNIDKAKEKLKILNMNDQERRAYEKYLMNTAIEKDVMSTSRIEGIKEGIQKGKIEGIKEGIQKGKIEGIKEGIQKGKIEGIEEGIQKGKIEGIEEGIQKGLLSGIEAILDIRFGETAKDIKEKIQKITDIEVLERLKEDLRNGKSIEEITKIYIK